MLDSTYTPSPDGLDVAHRAVATLSVSEWDDMSEVAQGRARALVSVVVDALTPDIAARTGSANTPESHLTDLATDIHAANVAKGFWDGPRPITETTMLIVTELAEAVEEDRAGRPDVWYQGAFGRKYARDELVVSESGALATPEGTFVKPEGVHIELVDALIRILDTLGAGKADVDELLRQKLAYNATRGHKHGKAY